MSIRFHEAIILGSLTQPLCRSAFLGRGGAGCLITAAVRACGRKPESDVEVVEAAFELWPWLKIHAMPSALARPEMRIIVGAPNPADHQTVPHMQSGVLTWIIGHYDLGYAAAWIANEVEAFEDWLVQMEAASRCHQAANAKQAVRA